MNNISIFGLGKLGLPMAVWFANKGFNVIGVDVSDQVINDINNKHCWLYEKHVQTLLNTTNNLIATKDSEYAVKNTDISFIFTGTPSKPNGTFSTKYVFRAGTDIANVLKNKNSYHLIVLRSTVLPGETKKLEDLIANVSNRRKHIDFGMCYNPESLALGRIIEDFTKPDLIWFGESDSKAGNMLATFYKKLYNNPYEREPKIFRTTFENAELAKLMLNNFVTAKMSFANMMAELCEKTPHTNVDEISDIIGADTRIGRKYLTGGLSYGGTCFPRDNKALIAYMKQLNIQNNLPEVIENINEMQTEKVVDYLEEKINYYSGMNNFKISILGLTFKPDTDVIEESASLKIINEIKKRYKVKISVHDPSGTEKVKSIYYDNLIYAKTIDDCLKDSDLCIIATPWEEYKTLSLGSFIYKMKQFNIFDCWRIYKKSDFNVNNEDLSINYFALGVNNGT